jgi:uncharacterized protein (DUF927 family)
LKGKITREKFLEMLTYHEETHQICFCTLNSLQTIDKLDDTSFFDIVMIAEPIIENLILDNQIDATEASDLFYNSKLFENLSDKTTKLYKKSWQEIYKMLQKEIESK